MIDRAHSNEPLLEFELPLQNFDRAGNSQIVGLNDSDEREQENGAQSLPHLTGHPMTKHLLERFPLHLGRTARATPQPEFTGIDWYQAYAERVAVDGNEARLVQMFHFDADWTNWERHPAGDEVVICTAGEMTLIQELPSGPQKIVLRTGEYAINPRGCWHTADVAMSASAIFITAGMGTEHRPR